MLYPIHTPNQLAAHLRALRLAKGLNQTELATMLGLTQSRVARIEKDPLSIRVDQLLRILAALGAGVSIESLGAQRSQGNNSGNNPGAW